ncbi:hypothetical protein ALC62_12285 [Cyphomyrmex costatus]|uniref:Uncharacterized protein n=1 Tax=Cyphomyrmex costatus TaxID=456900 RepID=A0A151IBJ4_9HYME|nr:hypothetical protein ALC62_12285 [Cyphomyrmex costatus]
MSDCKNIGSDNVIKILSKEETEHRILITTSLRHSHIRVSLPPTCLLTNSVRYFITAT